MKILLVEDDRSTREAIRRFIVWCGHDVKAASDPRSAEILAEELQPDLVICDWQLGDTQQDGIDVAKAIRDRHSAKVILITGRSLGQLKQRTGSLEVARYIRKPLSLASIRNALRDVTAPQ